MALQRRLFRNQTLHARHNPGVLTAYGSDARTWEILRNGLTPGFAKCQSRPL